MAFPIPQLKKIDRFEVACNWRGFIIEIGKLVDMIEYCCGVTF